PKAGALPGCATPRNTQCAGTKSISPGQKASGRPHRPAAVVHARLLLGRELRKGATERRVEEERIVAEAVRPARRVGDHAVDEPLGRVLPPGRVHEGDDTAEARRPRPGRGAQEGDQEKGPPGATVETWNAA